MRPSDPRPPRARAGASLLLVILGGAILALTWLGSRWHEGWRYPESPGVWAATETEPMSSGGDAADDVAIWVHPTRPGAGMILGTDKKSGLAIYDLDGAQVHFAEHGRINNVDLRQDVPWGDDRVDLAVATNKTHNALAVYRVVDEGRALELAGLQPMGDGIEAEGLCLYLSAIDDRLYAVATGKEGNLQQWLLTPADDGRPEFRRVRHWQLDANLEGCVADDEAGRLYVAGEGVGIWVFDAEPDRPVDGPELLDAVGLGGHLRHDVEGLAVYRQAAGGGYLLASSQGSDDFVAYDRRPPHAFRGRFHVRRTVGDAVDRVTHTDGIEVTSAALGGPFEAGLLVVQDHETASGHQNFKLVPWSAVARTLGLDAGSASAR